MGGWRQICANTKHYRPFPELEGMGFALVMMTGFCKKNSCLNLSDDISFLAILSMLHLSTSFCMQ